MHDDVTMWSTQLLLWVGTPGQLTFLLLYMTRPWRKYRPTRALMMKSAALGLLLFNSWTKLLVFGGPSHVDYPGWLSAQNIVINMFLLAAIYYQLYALIVEMRRGDRNSLEAEVTDKMTSEETQE